MNQFTGPFISQRNVQLPVTTGIDALGSFNGCLPYVSVVKLQRATANISAPLFTVLRIDFNAHHHRVVGKYAARLAQVDLAGKAGLSDRLQKLSAESLE